MARPFRFRLETVLKLRKQNEDEHKRIVADRVRQLNEVRRRLTQMENQIELEAELVRAGRIRGRIEAQDLARGRHWLSYLQRALLETQDHMRTVEARLDRERAELARAAKEAKALEKLKERQRQRHQAEEKRIERRELDEMAILRFAPPRSSEPRGASQNRTGSRAPARAAVL
jgi:flagellar FliJ protein